MNEARKIKRNPLANVKVGFQYDGEEEPKAKVYLLANRTPPPAVRPRLSPNAADMGETIKLAETVLRTLANKPAGVYDTALPASYLHPALNVAKVTRLSFPAKATESLVLPQLLRGRTLIRTAIGDQLVTPGMSTEDFFPWRRSNPLVNVVAALGALDARDQKLAPAALLALRSSHLYPTCRVGNDEVAFAPMLTARYEMPSGYTANVTLYPDSHRMLPPPMAVFNTRDQAVSIWLDDSEVNTVLVDVQENSQSAAPVSAEESLTWLYHAAHPSPTGTQFGYAGDDAEEILNSEAWQHFTNMVVVSQREVMRVANVVLYASAVDAPFTAKGEEPDRIIVLTLERRT